jgi:hypothetical protein
MMRKDKATFLLRSILEEMLRRGFLPTATVTQSEEFVDHGGAVHLWDESWKELEGRQVTAFVLIWDD